MFEQDRARRAMGGLLDDLGQPLASLAGIQIAHAHRSFNVFSQFVRNSQFGSNICIAACLRRLATPRARSEPGSIASPEMLDRAEASGDGHGHHRHPGLLQQLLRPLQPQRAVKVFERSTEMGCEQALKLPR